MLTPRRNDPVHRPLGAAALVLLVSLGTAPTDGRAAGSCDATTRDDALALVRDTTDQLFAAVEAHGSPLQDDPEKARELVEEYITPHVDLKGFSKLVLGKYWRRATPEQRAFLINQLIRGCGYMAHLQDKAKS